VARALRLNLDVALPAPAAFALLIDEMTAALARRGLEFSRGPSGSVRQGDLEVATVTRWDDGRRIVLRWHQANWDPDGVIDVVIAVDPYRKASRATVELRGLADVVGGAGELIGWFADAAIAPLLSAASPRAFGDWFTDRHARRPSGAQARSTYADPLYHYPNFRVILAELALAADDHFLEVGCGGGALLKAALESGCRAAAIDHSPDMVRLARQANAAAVAAGRLDVREARAEALPFADATFTAAAMTGVLGFLPDPVAAFAEIRRVLRPGGRFVGLGSDPELRGTPGAPEPMESRLRFYDTHELEQLARAAGFTSVRVLREDLEPFARQAGVPEEHLPLFAAAPGEGQRFLVCRTESG
jgi:ubiquinone/menaquinone biosynthesis C-methylase UbiE